MNFFRAVLPLCLAAIGCHSVVFAKDFSPSEYRDSVPNPTQVMVLGTAHLNNADDAWDATVLDPLMDRLAAFSPEVITIEAMDGATTTKTWAYRSVYPEVAATYSGRAILMSTIAGLSLDMDMPQAEAEGRRHLAKVGDAPSPADRRRSVALFAASGDPVSALVQWWHLPAAERVAGDGVSPRLATLLDELGREPNENALIAARLAVRLGHQRIYPMDSQEERVFTPEEADLFYQKVFPAIVERYNEDPASKERGSVAKMTTPESTLEAYRRLNDDRIERRLSEIEWLGALTDPTEGDVGRKRVAAWEARNLRMAANVREASARAPGGRALVIVGATHKIWLESYLRTMSDIEVVSTDTVLN